MTGVIVLAAGNSSRMGQPKQLLPFRGSTLLRHAAEIALTTGLGPVLIVLGSDAERCRLALEELDVRVVLNADWEQGMGTSIRAGIEALESGTPDLDGSLILLHDQPAISGARLRELVAARESNDLAVASVYDNTIGVPAFFVRDLFKELRQLNGHQGARKILEKHAPRVRQFDMPEAGEDIDTPSDYARWRDEE
jgi:molybdenum cofactor cytidylyltransferase